MATAATNGTDGVYLSRMESPAGTLWITVSDRGLVSVAFRRDAGTATAPGKAGEPLAEEKTRMCREQLREYFGGKRREFTLALDLRNGTDFQRRCWDALLRIPYGQTRSYRDIADEIGHPTAFRAVGQANHHNPIAIIIPCHRVITADGKLCGYGGGLPVKKMLLELEGAIIPTRPLQQQLVL